MGARDLLKMGNVVSANVVNPVDLRFGIVIEVASRFTGQPSVGVVWPNGESGQYDHDTLSLQFASAAGMYELVNGAMMASERSKRSLTSHVDERDRLQAGVMKSLGDELWQLGADHDLRNQMESIMDKYDVPIPSRTVQALITVTYMVEATAKDDVQDVEDPSFFDSSIQHINGKWSMDASWIDTTFDVHEIKVTHVERVDV